MGGFRGMSRLIALGRTAILARLLLPVQFGAFGVATLVLAFLEVFTETGINIFLIQENKDIDDYIDTAWIISIIRGIVITLFIILLARPIALFFDSPDSYNLILLISVVPLLRGFLNPSVIKFQKNLEFNKEFYMRTSVFVFESITAVILAYLTRSAIALAWSFIFGIILELILSYILVKPIPKFSFEFKKAKKIIERGKWVTASGVFMYLSQQGDDAFVGKIINVASLGLYQMAYKISTLPLTEVTQVVGKVTFPVYTKIANDTARLKRAFIKTVVAMSIVIIPIGLILFFFPREVITFILGPNWLGAQDVLRVLAIFGIIRALIGAPNAVFYALKKQKWTAHVLFAQLVGLALFIYPLTKSMGIVGAGIAAIISSLVSLPVSMYYLKLAFKNAEKK